MCQGATENTSIVDLSVVSNLNGLTRNVMDKYGEFIIKHNHIILNIKNSLFLLPSITQLTQPFL